MEKEVVNIARYYHHETVYIGGKENNIYNNICKGLDIIKVINYKLEDLIMPLRPTRVQGSIKMGRSTYKKRFFSCINALLLFSKHTCLTSSINSPII